MFASLPTRLLAGVNVPDSPAIGRAIEFARKRCEPYLFNHVMRSWLFAIVIADAHGEPYDTEVLAISTLLHDIGLAEGFAGPLRFEVEGANAARRFAMAEGLDERRTQLIWDSVALNSTPSICLHKERCSDLKPRTTTSPVTSANASFPATTLLPPWTR